MEKVTVDLAYGKEGLKVELPSKNLVIIEPRYLPGLDDERAALLEALRQPINSRPLQDMASPDKTVAIVFCDITRPMPNDRVLPVVLEELERAGIKRENITLINATGMHRPNSTTELDTMLGAGIMGNYRVINHNAFDKATLTHLGRTSFGAEAWVCSDYLNADLKILTGFIEPHFFAGFSGGPKMICPGVAGKDTVMHAHSARLIGSSNATWGITFGNPVHDEIREVAALAGSDFSINVTLNKDHRITAVFAGDVWESHRIGCEFVRETAMQACPSRYDIVLTTNSGYPLDQNLYQAVKGMSAAALVVKEGGTIISASECRDGIPNHGNYRQILQMRSTPTGLLDMINAPGFSMFDQWQVQVQAKIQLNARIFVKSDYLTDRQLEEAHFIPCHDIAETIEKLMEEYGPDATICVLPQGPQTVPYVAATALVS